MALGTRNANMNGLGMKKLHAFDNENAGARLGAKSIAAQKPTGMQRAALGNISNVVRATHAGGKKVVKRETRPKALTKSKATSSLHSVVSLPVENVPTDICMSPSPQVVEPMEFDDAIEAFSQQLIALQVEDIDRDDGDNPQLCSEYAKEIYLYMRQLEIAMKVPAGYLDREGTPISGRMRLILVDWLVQVHLRFHLLQETLFLTIQLIDRFLTENTVSKGKLQLVGVTAMFIASKYEEMYPPEINDFVYITDQAYTKAQIRQMEIIMLKGLDYNLGKPLCLHFLRRNSKAAGVDAQKHTLAKYLMEVTLPEYNMVQYDPSEIAAAAIYMSMAILDPESSWCPKMAHYSMYSEDHLRPIVQKLCQILVRDDTTSSKYSAVKTKYGSSKFMKISTIPQLESPLIKQLATSS